jgi:hypothetical protein
MLDALGNILNIAQGVLSIPSIQDTVNNFVQNTINPIVQPIQQLQQFVSNVVQVPQQIADQVTNNLPQVLNNILSPQQQQANFPTVHDILVNLQAQNPNIGLNPNWSNFVSGLIQTGVPNYAILGLSGVINAATQGPQGLLSSVGPMIQQFLAQQNSSTSQNYQALANVITSLGNELVTVAANPGNLVYQVTNEFSKLMNDTINRQSGNLIAGIQQYANETIQANAPLLNSIDRLINQDNQNISQFIPEINTSINNISTALGQLQSVFNIDEITSKIEQIVNSSPLAKSIDNVTTLGPLGAAALAISVKDVQLGGTTGTVADQFQALLNKMVSVFNKLRNNEYDDFNSLIADLFSTSGLTPFAQIAMLGVFAVLFTKDVMSSFDSVVNRSVNALANADIPTELLPVNVLVEARQKEIMRDDQVTTELAKHGLNDERITILENTAEQTPSLDLILELFHRGLVEQAKAEEYMRHLGMSQETIDYTIQTNQELVEPAGLIAFLERLPLNESETPTQDQINNTPQPLRDLLKIKGRMEGEAALLWNNHWDLPGLSSLMDLYRRGLIDTNTLRRMAYSQGIYPDMVDPLMQATYLPLEKRDLHQLISAKLITHEEAVRAFMVLGYHAQDAEKLVTYAEKSKPTDTKLHHTKIQDEVYNTVVRGLESGDISIEYAITILQSYFFTSEEIGPIIALGQLQHGVFAKQAKTVNKFERIVKEISIAYENNELTLEEAKQQYLAFGLSDSDASAELMLAEMTRLTKFREQVIEAVKHAYLQNTVDATEALSMLATHGIANQQAEYLLTTWDLLAQLRYKKLSEAELAKLLKVGIIDETQYATELEGLGYPDKYIEWLLALETMPAPPKQTKKGSTLQ